MKKQNFKKHIVKTLRISMVSLICLFLTVSLCLLPAAGAVNTGAVCSITVLNENDGTVLPGTVFYVYRVADISENGYFTLTDEYKAFGTDLNKLTETSSWKTAAENLVSYISANNLSYLSAKTTDSEGIAVFSGLKTGLYLVVGSSLTLNGKTYTCLPTPVVLPGYDSDSEIYNYDIIQIPKHDVSSGGGGGGGGTTPDPDDDDPDDDDEPDDDDGGSDNDDDDDDDNSGGGKKPGGGGGGSSKYIGGEDGDDEDSEESSDDDDDNTDRSTHTNGTDDVDENEPETGSAEIDLEIETDTQEPDSPEETENLPQTGQCKWPVPVFICIGGVMMLEGMKLILKGSEENDR
ncbi:MAG: hypothetical protein LUD77_09300 [Clostridiales bacterium]|nr:hypothetical protein [Clostridiales bacterium]